MNTAMETNNYNAQINKKKATSNDPECRLDYVVIHYALFK